jgi:hypothetical protein
MYALNKSKADKGFEAEIKRKGMEFTHVILESNEDDMRIWNIVADNGFILSPCGILLDL